MNLKRLVHRELGEGITEQELASAVGVSMLTIGKILKDKLPQDPTIWEAFAKYFRIDADVLRAGGWPLPEGVFELTETKDHGPVGSMRTVPLLNCQQFDQMVMSNEPPRVVDAEAMLETDVRGRRTFATMVNDASMEPLFSEGEIVFVNPELSSEPGHYVVVENTDSKPTGALLRQLTVIGGQAVLHALNGRYEDLPLAKGHRIWGRVVRLRKNL